VTTALFGLSACGSQNTQRDNVDQQNSANAQAKFSDLAPAEGTYTGNMTLSRSHQPFAITLQITRTPNTAAAPQAPSESFSRWILTGNMSFTALSNVSPADFFDFQELTDPMGGNASVSFNQGDLDISNSQLTLAYSVPNSVDPNYGQLIGTLTNGRYSGTWTASPVGTAGTFDLIQTTGAQ
jgi:hypothetical protein